MMEQKILALAQTFIGAGFFFLYITHIRSIHETRSNISRLPQLERESLFRREDALYYSFYRTLTDAPDFSAGYARLQNITDIEYPHAVNVLQRFQVLPELVIGFLYHQVLRLSRAGLILFNCWRTELPSTENIHERHYVCDTESNPLQFYLEFVWLMGGLNVICIYMYGTLLSDNLFGGIYAVLSYIIFHSFADKIYERPLARENFAFAAILLQIFYLCLSIDRVIGSKVHAKRISTTFKLTIFTTLALLCWQFSEVIFTTQILILMTPWSWSNVPIEAARAFTQDYALSQLMANFLAYYASYGNKKYVFAWQLGPAISLFLISTVQRMRSEPNTNVANNNSTTRCNNRESSENDLPLKTLVLGVLMAISAQGTVVDLLEKMGLARAVDNSFALYRDLFLYWVLQAKVSFSTQLAACNSAYQSMPLSELWELVKTLVVKPYCMYGVVMLAKWLRRWRRSTAPPPPPSSDRIERAKKYVLEDFLEDNRISISDIPKAETERELNSCLQLLEKCDYDYEKYKLEKAALHESSPVDVHMDFMNDIKKLKKQINDNNDKSKKQANYSIPHKNENKRKATQRTQPTQNTTASTETSSNATENTTRRSCARSATATKTKRAYIGSFLDATAVPGPYEAHLRCFHYIYTFLQMAVFTLMGLCVRKLFFLCFSLGCVLIPTLYAKMCPRKQYNIFFTISLMVFVTSIFSPGLKNIREEFFPTTTDHERSEDLHTMLEWIKINTEKDAVFAGPIDIIGTVHVTTKRPIVNHAHLEMRQISDRTESVYSIFSRQPSSDIYNQCSQLKIQYLIITLKSCDNVVRDDCDLLAIWDDLQPAYRKFPQFCSELLTKNIPSFLKVFNGEQYSIIKMFSQSVQINLKQINKMPEKAM